MGRVRVRDQYSGEHWIEESAMAFAPWRDCEVLERESPEAPLAEPASPAPEPQADDKPAKARKTAAE